MLQLPITCYNIVVPIYKTKNENFFKIWTPDMAYILGFFCADGAMTVNPRGSKYIDIGINDLDLLINIKECLGSNHKIKIRLPSSKGGKNHYRLQIGSKIMFQDLLNLGITPKKTFRMRIPKIPNNFFSDFIRGYFDGDGNVWCGEMHKERQTPNLSLRMVFTSGNKNFLTSIANYLKTNFQINGVIDFHTGAYRLTYSTSGSLFLYKFMYNKARLYLDRKKRVFDQYIAIKYNNAVVA